MCQSRKPRAPSSARRQTSSTRLCGPFARAEEVDISAAAHRCPAHPPAGLPLSWARAAPLVAPRADERGMCAWQWCTARCAAGRSARHCGRSTATPLTTTQLDNCERTGPCCGPCCGAARALRCAPHRTLTGAAYAHRGGALRAAVRSAPPHGLTSCAPHVVRKSACCFLRAFLPRYGHGRCSRSANYAWRQHGRRRGATCTALQDNPLCWRQVACWRCRACRCTYPRRLLRRRLSAPRRLLCDAHVGRHGPYTPRPRRQVWPGRRCLRRCSCRPPQG